MKRLHSPWRSDYIRSFASLERNRGCVLCSAWNSADDRDRFVVARGRHSFVIMNLYPYNSGHCMIVPSRHVGRLDKLRETEYAEMFRFIRKTVAALDKISSPDGFNIGSNLGRTAGAGIDTHVHFHVVPRWNGDTNFMPVLGDTKVISEAMDETWEKLRRAMKGRRR